MAIDNASLDYKSICVTRKELFYAAAMLHLKQLVNIVYDFPADSTRFDQELREAKSSLRKKNLLQESARGGVTLNFALTACAVFCSEPEKCEVIDKDIYHASVYGISALSMLLEESEETGGELKALWFLDKENLNKYIEARIKDINNKAEAKEEVSDNGRSDGR